MPFPLLEIVMAKMSIKVKKKPVRMGRAATKSLDQKRYGDEPILTGEITDPSDTRLVGVLNWYNYMHDVTQAKKWLLEYLKKEKRDPELIAKIRSAPDWKTTTTSGWVARMIMNGTILPKVYLERLEERIKENASYAPKVESDEEKEKKPTVSIQDRVKKATDKILANAESEVIDDRMPMYDYLQKVQATPAAAKKMLDYYQPIYDEVHSDDPQVKEAFGKKLKAERTFMQSVIDDLNRYIGNKKVVKIRKPREKKVKSAVELVKNMKYQKEFPPLKIVSVNPAELIGCKQLWTYNTKYKKLTRYDASGPNGIQVKGTTLTGFDVEQSLTKSLRKPDITIQQLLVAGKVALRSIMDTLKTNETKPNGRINEDTILLRVIK